MSERPSRESVDRAIAWANGMEGVMVAEDAKTVFVAEILAIRAENAKLKAENERLRKVVEAARALFREVLRWRDAEQNDGFPHDTRLSIIEWLEKFSAYDAARDGR